MLVSRSSFRPFLLVLLSSAIVLSLSSCSENERDGAPAASETTSSSTATDRVAKCTVQAAVTGEKELELEGEGEFIPSADAESQPALYIFDLGQNRLTVLASGGDFPTGLTLSVGKNSFSATDAGIDADPKGSGAEFDATAAGLKGEIDIVGEVMCD